MISNTRHAELVSASTHQPARSARAQAWTLKQVQGDDYGCAVEAQNLLGISRGERGMIGGMLFGLLGLVVIILTARNIRFAFSHGWVSAYGRQITRDTQPIAFGVSVCLAVAGLLFGLIMTTVAIAGVAGLLK